ncbi:MAG: hypothetical protein Q7S59_03275 [Sulfurimonas sp.]|nr:hypothetical protein [Sulfurimonas sp.]
MSVLNKIFYGPAGTGKTREAIAEAVRIVCNSEKLNLKFDYNDNVGVLKKFKAFAKTSKLSTNDEGIIKKIQNLSKTVDEVVNSLNHNDLKELTGDGQDGEKAKTIIEEYRVYPLIDTVTFHPSYTY